MSCFQAKRGSQRLATGLCNSEFIWMTHTTAELPLNNLIASIYMMIFWGLYCEMKPLAVLYD